MKISILMYAAIGIALLSAGCKDTAPDTPGSARPPISVTPPGDDDNDDFDFASELADPRTRFVSADMAMLYDNGGILVTSQSRAIEFINLNTEPHQRVTIESDSDFREGPAGNPRIYINGQPWPVRSVTVKKRTASTVYLDIIGPDQRHAVAVADAP